MTYKEHYMKKHLLQTYNICFNNYIVKKECIKHSLINWVITVYMGKQHKLALPIEFSMVEGKLAEPPPP